MQPKEQSEKSWTRRLETLSFQDPPAARQNFDRIAAKLSPELTNALPALLADSPDPDSSLLLFERLITEASPETLRTIEAHPFLAHYAIAVFSHSRYLGDTLVQTPDLLHTFLREKKLDRSFSHGEFSEGLARFRSRSFEQDNSLLLSRFKRREYLRIQLHDVLHIAPLAETTAETSALSPDFTQQPCVQHDSALEHDFA